MNTDFESLVSKCELGDFITFCKNSSTYSEVSLKLGYSKNGSKRIRTLIKKRMLENNIPLFKERVAVMQRTKGDLFFERKNWQSARSAIQKAARQHYFKSGKSTDCNICGYNKHTEVAHIRSVSDFDNEVLIKDINHIDNLICLCPNHHWEFDNKLLIL